MKSQATAKKVRIIRITAQITFLIVFLFLFRKTDFGGSEQLPYAVNVFFRLDPLVAAAVTLSQRTLEILLWPSLITLILTLIFGRFFCNWFCPLGTLLDTLHPWIKPGKSTRNVQLKYIKYGLLTVILASAVTAFPLTGFFDPFSILIRALTLSLDPALKIVAAYPFDVIYAYGPTWLTDITEPAYRTLSETVLPYRHSIYGLGVLSFCILAAIFTLEKIQQRFWCRNVCPLGALLGLVAKFSWLRMDSSGKCETCRLCRGVCRMGAIDDGNQVAPESCTLCLDCMVKCPSGRFSVGFQRQIHRAAPEGLTRRAFFQTALGGVMVPVLFKNRLVTQNSDPFLIRPPGALKETDFLDRCVRCGECMKVCIGNALHPAFLEAGVEGMFSPRLIARAGYCEYQCTLCGQVCPTGAIQRLSKEKKQKVVIGRAYFDKNRCLPYAKGIPCIVCEEHCPTPEKAIRFREVRVMNAQGQELMVKQPYVVDDLCIGCGICETKCPLPGASAVLVTSEGESRHPDKQTPTYGGYDPYGGAG